MKEETLNIRHAAKPDAERLENFLVLNFGEQYRKLAKDYINCMFSDDFRKPVFLVSEDQDGIFGTAAISEEFFTVNTWGISWVCVHPEKRNRGTGAKLIQACLQEIARASGKTVSVILSTYPNKTELYERSGFMKAGQDHQGGSFMVRSVHVV